MNFFIIVDLDDFNNDKSCFLLNEKINYTF
ncbi:hypothetical protein ABIC45_000014 [Mucilaginibacter rubeus]|jgi:hypothetical protein